MRKAIAVSAFGPLYEAMYRNVAPAFERYAATYDWDLKTDHQIPDWFVQKYSRPNWDFRLLCCAYKLYQPIAFSDYDLLAIFDPDILINPNAPCLSEYYGSIPKEGCAAAQDVSFEERVLFPGWNRYHYDDFLPPEEVEKLPYPEIHVNSGLVLVKPGEAKDEWLALLNMDSDFSDERRINVRITQKGKVFLLPSKWNVVYPYELIRRGQVPRHWRNRALRKAQRVWNSAYGEQRRISKIFQDAYALHFASTDKNIPLRVDVEKLLSAVPRRSPER